MKYWVNSRMVWYSKNNVLESGPNVFSNWFVSFIARMESIPYFSSAACGSILWDGSFNNSENCLAQILLRLVHKIGTVHSGIAGSQMECSGAASAGGSSGGSGPVNKARRIREFTFHDHDLIVGNARLR